MQNKFTNNKGNIFCVSYFVFGFILSTRFNKVVLGHHFVVNNMHITTAKQYCDHCTGIIWSVVQASFICSGSAAKKRKKFTY